MKKQLLVLAALGGICGAAFAWETPTIVMGTETMTIDTIFHAQVGPGTTQTQLHLSGTAPLDVFYLTTDLTTPGVNIRSVCAGGHTGGTMRTSAMAQNASDAGHLYFAGTNADFFWTSGTATDGSTIVGTPTYAAIVDGEVYKSSNAGYQFSMDAEGIARVCRLNFTTGTVSCNGNTAAFKGINTEAINNAVTMYNRRGWSSPCQGQFAGACAEVSCRLVDGNSFVSGRTYQVEVLSSATSTGDPAIPENGCILMARGNAMGFIQGLQPGDIVTVDNVILTPEGQRVYPTQVVSGNPKNVGGGENLHSEAERADATDRHPRTAIGYSQDGNTVIMMVVDGRGPSKGVTTGMLGDLMLYAGAYEAVNLDGGGSSTLYTSALGVRNRCSDGNERAVGNAIFATIESEGIADTKVAAVRFTDWRMSLPQLGLYTPAVYAFNAAGVLINTDFKDYTLSCDASLGEIINDGHTLLATGNGLGALTVSYPDASSSSIAVEVVPCEIRMRMDRVVLNPGEDYTLELLANTLTGDIPVSPVAFSWTSSDASIATVTPEGLVHSVSEGECTVTGISGDKTLQITILVQRPEADIMPIESELSGWTVKKTLMADLSASILENGLALDYTMSSSTRGAKITLTARKDLIGRPKALRMHISSATAVPASVSFTFRAANASVASNIVLSEFNADGTADWTMPFSDYYDTDDAATYPIEFVSAIVTPGDASKAVGHIDIPALEVIYPEGASGVETISIDTAASGTARWYTISGMPADPAHAVPGLYIRVDSRGSSKVLLR